MRCNSPMENCILPIENINYLFVKSTESTQVYSALLLRRYFVSLMNCNSPMASWTFPIENKYSPFDKSIESTKVRSNNEYSPFDKSAESIESQKFMEPFYYCNIFLSLVNDMQPSPMESWTVPIEYKYSPFDKLIKSIPWSQRLSLILSFSIWKFATRSALCQQKNKRS